MDKVEKKKYIKSLADMKRTDLKKDVDYVTPKRRAIMTSDREEEFISQYYTGRTEALRWLLKEDMEKKGWNG